jgi:hypothetical protein
MGVMKLNDFYVCNAKLKLAIRDNLDKFQARPQVKEGVQQAAVALTIVDVAHGSDAYALPCYKTRRSDAATSSSLTSIRPYSFRSNCLPIAR